MHNQSLLPGIPLVESPLFESLLPESGLTPAEQLIARQIHEQGFAVIDHPDPAIAERIGRIIADLSPQFGLLADGPHPAEAVAAMPSARVQDAWKFNEDVRAIAANTDLLGLLSRLWGRSAIPFQTLNFPVGTQQHLHTDAVHFSSQPERFMCGVWVAFEDLHPDSGILTYLPGSHRWPILSNALIGRRGKDNLAQPSAQTAYEPVWRAMVEASGLKPGSFLARKGQALIWAANLLHGGAPRTDPTRTRWSQVTHYYFDDCLYYTPAYSDEVLGKLHLRHIVDVGTGQQVPNRYQGAAPVFNAASPERPRRAGLKRLLGRPGAKATTPKPHPELPEGFNEKNYLTLNPDVAAAGADPVEHYLTHGRSEGRPWRLR